MIIEEIPLICGNHILEVYPNIISIYEWNISHKEVSPWYIPELMLYRMLGYTSIGRMHA